MWSNLGSLMTRICPRGSCQSSAPSSTYHASYKCGLSDLLRSQPADHTPYTMYIMCIIIYYVYYTYTPCLITLFIHCNFNLRLGYVLTISYIFNFLCFVISVTDFELQAPNLSGECAKPEAKVQWAPQNLEPRGSPKIFMSIILNLIVKFHPTQLYTFSKQTCCSFVSNYVNTPRRQNG